jgi:hypothetical protein
MQCRTLDAPAPWAAGTTTAARGYSLRRFSRLGLSWPLAVVGASALITAPTASRNANHELSLDTGLIAAAALACPPRDGRAAGRYRRTSSPQRLAAKLAPRGQARLWGTIATPTQRYATARHITRTRWKVRGRTATGTQFGANAGYATRKRHSRGGNAVPTGPGQSRFREAQATQAKDAGPGPNAAQRDWKRNWTAQRPPVYCFLTACSRCVPTEP